MGKRIFFSFHYQDVIDFRANTVRNHWLTKPNREQAGFFDASVWEEAKKTSDMALKRLINGALKGTSVTAILTGTETSQRRWVRYEIFKSVEKANHNLVAIHIQLYQGEDKKIKPLGPTPESLGSTSRMARLIPFLSAGRNWYYFKDVDPGAPV
jgi:hypothetical protein